MIKDNVQKIRQNIAANVTLVAVSKGRPVEEIKQAIEAGITDIGENRVQEAVIKYSQLTTYHLPLTTIKWHMVGHLQVNKVRQAVQVFDLIQSVDSLHLAQELDKQAKKIDKIQDILIEVNTSGEKAKFGMRLDEAVEVIKKMRELRNINIKGLMTIAPIVDNPEKTRPYFRMLRDLKEQINHLSLTPYHLSLLSMGMSDDYKIAIEEGSNIVRLGRAIFGG